MPPLRRPRLSVGLLLIAFTLPWLSGCSDDALTPPDVENDLFDSYVALGNSITAGFQSNGISASTQQTSYAVLLSEQMGTPFGTPSLAPPGCPPPVEDIFSASVGNGPSGCALRSSSLPPTLNNVAVPGAQVFDALFNVDPTGDGMLPVTSTNELTQFILGGRTQVEAAQAANPTFASVWLGNNDLLGAALAGVPDTTNGDPNDDLGNFPAPSTPPSLFEQQYASVVDSLVEAGAKRGVLIAVANPTLVPNFVRGQALFAGESEVNAYGQALVAQSPQFDNWGKFEADSSCASSPGANIQVPLSFFFQEFLSQALLGFTSTLDCDPAAVSEQILTPREQAAIESRLDQYNALIENIAQENNWAFVEGLNGTLQGLYQNDLVPRLPAPRPDSPTFGRYFSEDGVHPSSTTHRVVAHLIIRKLNNKYDDVQLEQIDIPDEVRPLLP